MTQIVDDFQRWHKMICHDLTLYNATSFLKKFFDCMDSDPVTKVIISGIPTPANLDNPLSAATPMERASIGLFVAQKCRDGTDLVSLSHSYGLLAVYPKSPDLYVTEILDHYLVPMLEYIKLEIGKVDDGANRTEQSISGLAQIAASGIQQISSYVDSGRIAALKDLQSPNFDLLKLTTMCEELNRCSQNQCYHSVAMLTRAILDHIPPIFGKSTFTEVANNYRGAKSFKESIQHLENSSRKIADSHLHTLIRKKETVPTFTQVNFSNDLDVLLAEIIRILK